MTGSRRAANKNRCRQQILKASKCLFKEKGFEKTMIEDVAEKAEVSKATLYNYFSNKEGLLAGTMEEEINALMRYVESIRHVEGRDQQIRLALKALIMNSIPFVDVCRKILFLNACTDSPVYGKANDVKVIFSGMVEQAKAENIFRNEIPTGDIVELLMGIYLSSQLQWHDIETMTEEQCSEKIDRIIDLTLSGCYKRR